VTNDYEESTCGISTVETKQKSSGMKALGIESDMTFMEKTRKIVASLVELVEEPV